MRPGALARLTEESADGVAECSTGLVTLVAALPDEALAEASFIGALAAEAAVASRDLDAAVQTAQRVVAAVAPGDRALAVLHRTLERAESLRAELAAAG